MSDVTQAQEKGLPRSNRAEDYEGDELECPQCGLSFPTRNALHVHTERFCGKMEGLGAAEDAAEADARAERVALTFEDVKRYLEGQGDDDDTGQLSLLHLRQAVRSNDAEMTELKTRLQKRRADQRAHELRQLKVRQQEARARKLQEHAQVEELMEMELKEKENELQAGLERERITRELRNLKAAGLTQLHEEKARSLAMLEQEKQALKRREEELLEHIKSVERKIIERDTQLKDEANALGHRPEKALREQSDDLMRQLALMAQEHGARVAKIDAQKRQLEEEQKVLAIRLQDICQGHQHQQQGAKASNRQPRGPESVDIASLQSMIKDQEARMNPLKRAAGASLTAATERPSTEDDDEEGLRERELKALASDPGTKLPLAKEAEKLLEQWLKDDGGSNASVLGQIRRKYARSGVVISDKPRQSLMTALSIASTPVFETPRQLTKDMAPAQTSDSPKSTKVRSTEGYRGAGARSALDATSFCRPRMTKQAPLSVDVGLHGTRRLLHTSRREKGAPREENPAQHSAEVQRHEHIDSTRSARTRGSPSPESEGSPTNSPRGSPTHLSATLSRKRMALALSSAATSVETPGGDDVGSARAPKSPRNHRTPPRVTVNTHDPGRGERDKLLHDIEALRMRCLADEVPDVRVLRRLDELEAQVQTERRSGATARQPHHPQHHHHHHHHQHQQQVPSQSSIPPHIPGASYSYEPSFVPFNALTTDARQAMQRGMAPPAYNLPPQTHAVASASLVPDTQQQQHVALMQAYQQLLDVNAETALLQEDLAMSDAGLGYSLPDVKSPSSVRLRSTRDDDVLQAPTRGAAPTKPPPVDGLMKALNALPPGHKLHKRLEEHVEDMAHMQFEAEKLQREAQLDIFKRSIRLRKELQEKQQRHEEWLEEQKRLADVARLERALGLALAKQVPSAVEKVPNLPYDPEAGFLVSYDFMLGVPEQTSSGAATKKARLVYGLYESSRKRVRPTASPWLDSITVAGLKPHMSSCGVPLSLQVPCPQVPAADGVYLVMEAHFGNDNTLRTSKDSRFHGGGWGYVQVFSTDGVLNKGNHKVKLLAGSFTPKGLEGFLKQDGKEPLVTTGAVVCLRINHAGEKVEDLLISDIARAMDIYITPRILSPAQKTDESSHSSPGSDQKLRAALGGVAAAVSLKRMPTPPADAAPPKAPPMLAVPAAAAGGGGAAATTAPPASDPPSSQASRSTTQPQAQAASAMDKREEATSDSGAKAPTRADPPARRASVAAVKPPEQTPPAPAPVERKSSSVAGLRRQSVRRHSSIDTNTTRGFLADLREDQPDSPTDSPVLADEPLFIENLVPGGNRSVKLRPWASGDGFQLYLDGARGLPDNVTYTKATVRVLNIRGEQLGPESLAFSDVEKLRAAPEYGMFVEYRTDAVDPTATCLVRLDTICLHTKDLLCVGYALFNVFTRSTTDRRKQPKAADVRGFLLNRGAFQLPLHEGPPDLKKDFNADSLSGVKRIPCATVLLRLHPAIRTDDGLSLLVREDVSPDLWERTGVYTPPPPYSQGSYDTTRCMPSDAEKAIYQRREQNGSEHRELLRAAMMTAFPPGDQPPVGSAKAAKEWMAQKLAAKPTEMMGSDYVLPYQPDLGIKVAVDGLCNLPVAGLLQPHRLYKVLYLLSPPALYYHDPPLTEETFMTREYDFESPSTAPLFKNGFSLFKSAPPNASTLILFEVRSLRQDPKGLKVEPAKDGYWTCLPVFHDGLSAASLYVNKGDFQLPLFKGAVPDFILDAEDGYGVIQSQLKASISKPKGNKGLQLVEGASIAVRVSDGLLEGDAPCSFTGVTSSDPASRRKSVTYIVIASQAAGVNPQIFDPRPPARKTVRQIAEGSRGTDRDFFRSANKLLAEAAKLTHYVF